MSDQFDLGALLEKAQAMQQQLVEAQAAAAEQVVEGRAGGGAVKVRITGAMKVTAVIIDPEVVDPADPGMLEDLVVAATNDALARVQELNQEALGGLDLGGAAGGLNLGI
ncbi:MAG: YbaB/EbfC family nucleoid-associated protein [Acidimicrobiales bacterium]